MRSGKTPRVALEEQREIENQYAEVRELSEKIGNQEAPVEA